MAIIVFCPGCKTRLTMGDDRAGDTLECPQCDATITIPALMPPPPPPLPTAPPTVYTWPTAPAPDPDAAEEEPRAPRSRRRRDEDGDGDDDKPWARGSRRRRDDEDDEDEDEPPRRFHRRRGKSGKVSAIGGMLLGGGACALVNSLLWVLGSMLGCCLWPGIWFGVVWGILAIVRGATLLGDGRQQNPHSLLVMQILQIVNLDVINLVLGILGLTFNSEREVKDSYRW